MVCKGRGWYIRYIVDYGNYCRKTFAYNDLEIQIMVWVGLGLFIYGLCTLNLWAFLGGLALFIIFVGHGH